MNMRIALERITEAALASEESRWAGDLFGGEDLREVRRRREIAAASSRSLEAALGAHLMRCLPLLGGDDGERALGRSEAGSGRELPNLRQDLLPDQIAPGEALRQQGVLEGEWASIGGKAVATRIDELRLLGNGVVPMAAAYAIRTLGHRLAARSAPGAAELVRMMA